MLSKLIHIGVKPELSLREIKRIKLLNQIVLLYVVGVFLKFLMELFVWDLLGMSIASAIIALFSIGSVLNYFSKLSAARIYFTFVFTIVLSLLIVLYGHNFGSEFAFFPLIMVIIIFFESNWAKLLWILFIAISYLSACLFVQFHEPLFLDNLSNSVFYFMFSVSFFGVFLMSYMFINENKHFEIQTNELLETLKTKNKHLETANNELEKFAYVASHDLKTPLRNIHGFLTLIKRKVSQGKTAEIDEFLDFASDNAHRMHELIQDVLEFSQFNAKKVSFEVKDLNVILNQSFANLQQLIEEKKAVVNTTELPSFYCNDSQMLSLFQNLIENGLKYNEAAVPIINIKCETLPNYYKIYIADNGIGIEKEYQEKIFEMFYRLHNQGEYTGSGIGLATCRKIVSHHNGTLTLESTPNQGTTFCILLPKNTSKDNSIQSEKFSLMG